MTNSNDRLDQIEKLLQQSIVASNERMRRMDQRIEQERAESRERLTSIEQLTQSNSRTIQALADRIAKLAFVQQEAAEERRQLREATLRLEGLAESIANLLSSRLRR